MPMAPPALLRLSKKKRISFSFSKGFQVNPYLALSRKAPAASRINVVKRENVKAIKQTFFRSEAMLHDNKLEPCSGFDT